ncbi:MAG: sn-glycerol-3-phosphate ABC transporter ATP-binding protein UgpC [Planctomycetes bacterium]|nr:sn-glycerol-3-phosphate ABC transporter ATP-binding protein UgpC [Planctomycetota bacterium]
MAGILIKDLQKIYDNGYHAVKDANLEIRDREFMVLVGPSGCGKTTTLRMIAGLEDISGGEIRIGERRLNEVAPKDRDIAMVFQSYALYPHMSVYENMAFALRLRKMPKPEIHAKVMEAAKMLSLGNQLEKLPKQLSGGQRQRVALGRAIVRQPKAFLFDEPLSNLDAKLRGEMRYELKSLQTRLATTAVYVTHDQIEAMTLGDRITVMSVGEIQQVAPPTVVYEFPYNRFVASFIGTPPMNFVTGKLVREGDTWSCEMAKGQRFTLGMKERGKLAENLGKDVVLGVRPEHLHAPQVAPAGCAVCPMKVDVVEHMGDHQYIYLLLDGVEDTVIMKAPPQVKAAPGDIMPVHLDTAAGHLFAGTHEHAPNITLPAGFPRQQ